MNNKKKNEGQTDFSYYGLYLLDYLRTNKDVYKRQIVSVVPIYQIFA